MAWALAQVALRIIRGEVLIMGDNDALRVGFSQARAASFANTLA